MLKLRINVTQDDIDNGERSNPNCCPIAHAVTRMGFSSVRVEEAVIGFTDAYKEIYKGVPLTRAAKRFIKRFDRFKKVHPSTFIIQAATWNKQS